MALEAGSELGPYSIVEPIGAGGMGQVYRAKDTRLDREVAIKVLPPQVANDASALARFEREARSVAALSHPNILAIHDIGQQDDRRYVVVELIEGDTLRERLDGDGFDVRKAIEVGSQIARGLGAAHAKGIVHRDLKPENVMITRDGQAKILDFGLSVWDDGGNGAASGDHSPTRTSLTSPGTVMGTVGYMSPEQVRGEPADARSDIFSFGALLYEMLTGTRAFRRETAAETMTAILREAPPEPSESGVSLPPATQAIVRRCLEKRPEERFRSAEDLAFALEASATGSTDVLSGSVAVLAPTAPVARGGMSRVALLVAGLVLLAAGYAAGRVMTAKARVSAAATSGELVRLTYEKGMEASPSIAPGGRSLAYVALVDDEPHVFVRRVGGETSLPLTPGIQPAFSPDGERIAYAAGPGGGIWVMGATGESRRRLTDSGFNPAWSPDGREIVASCESIQNPTGRTERCRLTRIDAASGESSEIPIDVDDAVQPHWSPGGHRIAFWGLPPGTGRRALYTAPAEGGAALQLTDDDAYNWNPVWSPDGRWLYYTSDHNGRMNIWRMPIDELSGESRGDAEPVSISTEEVQQFSIAADGSLVFASASIHYNLGRRPFDVDRFEATGPAESVLEGSRPMGSPALAPDGSKIAFVSNDPLEDLYVVTVETGEVRRLTQDRFKDRGPKWSGSDDIVFFSDRSGRYDVWRVGADGSALVQLTSTASGRAYSPLPSPDGTYLVIHTDKGAERVDIDGQLPTSKYTAFPPTPDGRSFFAASWSPDGESIAGVAIPGPGVLVYDVAAESYRLISERGGFPAWSGDESIVFPEDGELHMHNVRTGAERMLPTPFGDDTPFGRAGGYLYTRRVDSESDIWLLRPAG